MVHSLKENKILRKKSETDALTGLPNRFAYDYYSNAIYDAMLKNPHTIAFEIPDCEIEHHYSKVSDVVSVPHGCIGFFSVILKPCTIKPSAMN